VLLFCAVRKSAPALSNLVTARVLEKVQLSRWSFAGRTDVPKIVDWHMEGKIIDDWISPA